MNAGSTPPPSGGLGFREETAGVRLIGPTTAPFPRRRVPARLTAVLVTMACVGTLGVGASYALRSYIEHVKTAEARIELAKMAAGAVAAYERDGRICPSASEPVPTKPEQSIKYQSRKLDWEVDRERNAGFWCLGYDKTSIQHFQYEYVATPTTFTARARGVVRGDGPLEEIEATGELRNGELVIHTP